MIAALTLPGGWQLSEPAWLLLALLPPVVWLASRRRQRPDTSVPFAAGLPTTLRQRLRLVVPALQILGITTWVVALARPVELRTLPEEAPGIDILLVLDRSSSMAQEVRGTAGTTATRLAAVQAAAADFAAGRRDDRIGLVSFARYPDLLTPPTSDLRAVRELLAGITPEEPDSPEDMTGIGAAVARGAQVLDRSGSPTRVLILWTDGQENVATRATPNEIPPTVAAQLCQRLGVRVHVVSAGEPGEGLGAMTRLAESTGGKLFPVTDGSRAREVFAAIDTLERTPQPRPRVDVIERALPTLLLGLLLWGAGLLLSRTGLEVVR